MVALAGPGGPHLPGLERKIQSADDDPCNRQNGRRHVWIPPDNGAHEAECGMRFGLGRTADNRCRSRVRSLAFSQIRYCLLLFGCG